MTTPCEHKDDISEIRKDIKSLKESFETFRLNASIDIATLKSDTKKTGGRSGGIWGAIVVIILSIAERVIK